MVTKRFVTKSYSTLGELLKQQFRFLCYPVKSFPEFLTKSSIKHLLCLYVCYMSFTFGIRIPL